MFSQLLVGGRSTILVAVLAGVVATVLSVVIGVTAGYFGGCADDLLSMLANFFLVLPALPLLIVIFGFLPPGANPQRRADRADHRGDRLGVGRPGAAGPDPVACAPGTTSTRRGSSASKSWRIIGVRDPAQPDPGRGVLVPVHRAVRGRHVHRAGLPRPGRHRSTGAGARCCSGRRARRRPSRCSYWWWFVPPGLAVALLGTALALLNFGIDEFINPRLRGGPGPASRPPSTPGAGCPGGSCWA